MVRTGGWSELFSDEGSAYWIAARALNVFSRMSDGRLPEDPLAQLLCEHLQLTSILEVIDVALNCWQGHGSEIASLTPLVVEPTPAGDTEANAILVEACRELALLVDSTRRQLGFSIRDMVLVSYSGGVFRSVRVLAGFTGFLRGCSGLRAGEVSGSCAAGHRRADRRWGGGSSAPGRGMQAHQDQ
ncbi:BadF/BadG/BcrA/BcrD ATPase family protein [Streptomyces sp. NPDC050523]|uniref:BadF/BadG/BcrA/BcrD ATPase family protein n=1 Tax=Streptomyces sp. NPDC050523 TaxID=3365622 RepID=UPI0037B065C4